MTPLPRMGDPLRPDFHACSGCGLCLLPCPVWHERRDFSFTLAGRAKAMQGGAEVSEIAASALACVLCGACEVVCPENIDTVGFNLGVRAQLVRNGHETIPTAPSLVTRPPFASARGSACDTLLIAGGGLGAEPALLARVIEHLGGERLVSVAPGDGHAETAGLESGMGADLRSLVDGCRGAREVVAVEGLLHRPLRAAMPGRAIIGLGEALLRRDALRAALGADDLYIIESRAYHADFERLVRFYDRLRLERGCATNLDLHRAALTTGRTSLQSRTGAPSLDPVGQARWIAEGRRVRRVVVEAVEDRSVFRQALGVPVMHLAEIA